MERSKALWSPKYARFMRKGGDFTQQFSHMYMVRTTQMRPLLQAAAKQKWGSGEWLRRDDAMLPWHRRGGSHCEP